MVALVALQAAHGALVLVARRDRLDLLLVAELDVVERGHLEKHFLWFMKHVTFNCTKMVVVRRNAK